MARQRTADRDEAVEDTLDFRQAQEFLSTTRVTLYRWIAQKRVRAFKAGRQWRFYKADLIQFLEQPDPSVVHVAREEVERAVDLLRRWQTRGARRKAAALRPAPAMDEEPVRALAEALLDTALRHETSHVHLDPSALGGTARLRIDGVLHPIIDLSKSLYAPLVTHFKQVAEMDAADRASMQMGRIPTRTEGRADEVLVSTLPTPRGEKLTLWLSSSVEAMPTLDDVGLSPEDRERLGKALRQPTGIVIVGGPGGCGKTTVLYAALRSLVTPERSTMTIESTAYHWLPGAVQVQTNPRGGITYASALQGVMRADPDIVAVMDVPDRETAALSVEAGLSGHLVLLQLHANDAASAIRRLIDLGVEPFLLASSLIASMNQRLVRQVCSECPAPLKVSDEVLRQWRERAVAGGLAWPAGKAHFTHGKGCARCRGTGYHGRTAIFELLEAYDEVAGLITRGAEAAELREAGLRGGMTSLFADGIRKALAGVTSPLEVVRVT